ncbi:hypothetical protein [Brevundimonas sp.]|uniref:hypothetical protein n=1 Tax=Brevundimonas sp. TaxID=1871086 RepID=UPI0025EAD53B|nr:hypothetical protein [Brevundimonas sp.]
MARPFDDAGVHRGGPRRAAVEHAALGGEERNGGVPRKELAQDLEDVALGRAVQPVADFRRQPPCDLGDVVGLAEKEQTAQLGQDVVDAVAVRRPRPTLETGEVEVLGRLQAEVAAID